MFDTHLRPYQLNLCCLGQRIFQRRSVGRLENDHSSHMIMIMVVVLLQNVHYVALHKTKPIYK